MDVPDEFNKFCGQFPADPELYDDSFERQIRAGLERLTTKEKERLKIFFMDVLENDRTDDELEAMWTKSPADMLINGAGVKHVISEALKDL